MSSPSAGPCPTPVVEAAGRGALHQIGDIEPQVEHRVRRARTKDLLDPLGIGAAGVMARAIRE
jgi:hypothetical protein